MILIMMTVWLLMAYASFWTGEKDIGWICLIINQVYCAALMLQNYMNKKEKKE